jgi:hypothetical protein
MKVDIYNYITAENLIFYKSGKFRKVYSLMNRNLHKIPEIIKESIIQIKILNLINEV